MRTTTSVTSGGPFRVVLAVGLLVAFAAVNGTTFESGAPEGSD